ncbi:MAG: pilus assembly PilX N-terminal domain-containing protein [Syntrophothermus sp.]|uniref:pilus assembly PilX N-terminal domain-containing protein n=1 Tax=Syntrophothermus sp. TaxID=2736299 RepID=UPI00257C65DE|nr:pilus assembly PilX N-terminal domain-containing protein [Syntrophothermus sp.]NSW84207.1 pilus assembly PilX N-terminal domain-containing protein [Syntrophothermus sp.]
MLRDQRGQALVLVLILTTVIFMIGSAAVAMGTAARKNATLETWQKKAYYIAEAGIEMALADLRRRLIYPAPNFEEFRIDDKNKDYAGGRIDEVTVTKETSGNDIFYTITSSAYYPASGGTRARKTIRVKVKVVPDPFLSYGGPGLKSDTNVQVRAAIADYEGSIVARSGNLTLESSIQDWRGGLYAGGDVTLSGLVAGGEGEIKAGRNVTITGFTSTWSGEIWAGQDVIIQSWWPAGEVTVHENCGAEIPGFPIPEFPVVDKNSLWYARVKNEAVSKGQYFENATQFLDDDPEFGSGKGIHWRYSESIVVFLDYVFVTVNVYGAELPLNGLYVVGGALTLDPDAYTAAYNRWRQRMITRYQQRYPGKSVRVTFFNTSLSLAVKADQPTTLVADSVKLDEGFMGLFGVDTSGIKNSFGLFAVAGNVTYDAAMGTGGRLAVMTAGTFDCNVGIGAELKFDWVAAKQDIEIDAIINLNAAQASVPPGTPVGYRIVAWE